MSAAQERDGATQVAETDFPTALRRARGVSEAWYRAQALAHVARFAPEADVERIAREALEAAAEGRDTYQQVAAGAWPVRALAERGRARKAIEAVSRLAARSVEIAHPVNRLDALFLLWQAAWPLDRAVRRQVLSNLVAACHAASSWKAGYRLHDVILMLAPKDPREAGQIIEQMPEGRYRRQAQRHLAEGRTLEPRLFF